MNNGTLLLACDIGGTNTSIALLKKTKERTFSLLELKRYPSKRITDLEHVLSHTIAVFQKKHAWTTIPKLSISAAGPTDGETCYPSNLENWKIERKEIARYLKTEVLLINDFAAIAYSLVVLDTANESQLVQIAGPKKKESLQRSQIKLVIGVGTGLGVAILHIRDGIVHLIPTEGGWRNFCPSDELSLLYYLFISKNGTQPCSWEDAICGGTGIPTICAFLSQEESKLQHDLLLTAEEKKFLSALLSKNKKNNTDVSASVSKHALKGNSACIKVMRFWITLYAKCSSETAVLSLPFGGVYIAGGVATKNLPFFTGEETFHRQFLYNKNKEVRKLYKKMPLYIVTDYNSSLYGNAFLLDQSFRS